MNNLEKIAEVTGGKVWQKHGKNRVYIETQKGSNAYVEFDEVLDDWQNCEKSAMSGAALKVFTEGEDVKWAISQSKQLKWNLMRHIAGKLDLPDEMPEHWREVSL